MLGKREIELIATERGERHPVGAAHGRALPERYGPVGTVSSRSYR